MNTIWLGFGRRWRGFYFERTLFGPVLRCGWISFGVSKHDLPDWVRAWHRALDLAIRSEAKPSNGKGQQR